MVLFWVYFFFLLIQEFLIDSVYEYFVSHVTNIFSLLFLVLGVLYKSLKMGFHAIKSKGFFPVFFFLLRWIYLPQKS